jgi:hypothetical protein
MLWTGIILTQALNVTDEIVDLGAPQLHIRHPKMEIGQEAGSLLRSSPRARAIASKVGTSADAVDCRADTRSQAAHHRSAIR